MSCREKWDQRDQEECDFFTCRSKQEIETYSSFVEELLQSLLCVVLIESLRGTVSSTPSTSANFQPPHIGSHPLSKTMSLPASPINSPTATSHSIPPRPSSVAPDAQAPHQNSSSQPLQRLPSKTPSVQNGRPHPLAQTQTNALSQPSNYPTKAPVRPPVPKPPIAKVQNDDRPDSDSEDSDSDLEISSTVPSMKPPQQPQASKTPRVPPPASKTKVGTKNGVSEGMQRNGSSQKQPRKQMPPSGGGNGGGNGAGAIGRKAARPIAGGEFSVDMSTFFCSASHSSRSNSYS